MRAYQIRGQSRGSESLVLGVVEMLQLVEICNGHFRKLGGTSYGIHFKESLNVSPVTITFGNAVTVTTCSVMSRHDHYATSGNAVKRGGHKKTFRTPHPPSFKKIAH